MKDSKSKENYFQINRKWIEDESNNQFLQNICTAKIRLYDDI